MLPLKSAKLEIDVTTHSNGRCWKLMILYSVSIMHIVCVQCACQHVCLLQPRRRRINWSKQLSGGSFTHKLAIVATQKVEFALVETVLKRLPYSTNTLSNLSALLLQNSKIKMSSLVSVRSRGRCVPCSVRRQSSGSIQKAKKEKSERKDSNKNRESISLEGCLEDRDWDGALGWLVREEQVRDDLPFSWPLDSCEWPDDYTNYNSDSDSSLNVLNKACQNGAPIHLVNRIMMMYPLMIKSVSPSGKTTLHTACEYGASAAVVESLCDEVLRVAPSLLLAEDMLGMTAFQYCLFKKNADPDTISALREALCE
jgi:hypothetical protein